MGEQVTIIVGPDGAIKIEVAGVAGHGCKEMTAALERVLGKVTGDTLTADYYKRGQANVRSRA